MLLFVPWDHLQQRNLIRTRPSMAPHSSKVRWGENWKILFSLLILNSILEGTDGEELFGCSQESKEMN